MKSNYLIACVVLTAALQAGAAQGAIGFRAAAKARAGAGVASVTVTRPAGTVANDVMIAGVVVRPCSNGSDDNCTVTVTAPAAWTLVRALDQRTGGGNGGFGLRLLIYRRVAGAGEPASYTWSFGGNPLSGGSVAGILTFSGVDTTNPIVAEAGQTTGSGRGHTAPSIDTGAVTAAYLVSTHSVLSSGTWTPPVGMTEVVDNASRNPNHDLGASLEMNYEMFPAAGNTGFRTATLSNPPAGDTGATHMLALRPSPPAPVVSSFNAYETSTAPPDAIIGIIKTKIAGANSRIDVIALNAAKTAIEPTFAGAVKIELLNATNNSGALDANGCRSTWTLIQTLGTNPSFVTADSGRKTVTFLENNAWPNVRVRISYPATGTPTAIGCSNDNFAIRPAAFTAPSASDSDWETAGTARALTNTLASGGAVHKAGRPFTLRANAINAAATSAVTTNYTGTPSAAISACGGSGCGAVLGTLSFATSAVSGAIAVNNASYSEVGAFSLQLVDSSFASVDAGDSSTAERYITSPVVTVGRFVPNHFDITVAVAPVFKTFNDTICATRSFTYIGQGFGYLTLPRATITARNAAGGITASYRGALWKLTAASVTQTYAPLAPAMPGLDISGVGAVSVASNNDGTGSYSANSSDLLVFVRNTTTPQVPFNANITLTVSAADGSESAVAGNGTITTAAPLVFNGSGGGIAFDAGNLFRYGRMKLGNAYGSERLDLPVPLTAQYWNGYAFVTNTADYCTSIAAASIKLSGYQPAGFAANVPQGNVSISGRLAAGIANLKLLKPAPAASGSLNLCVDLDSSAAGDTTCQATTPAARPYLQDRRTGATYTQDPTGRAAFGLYKGPNNFIYLRENY